MSVSVVDTSPRPKSDSQATGPLGNEFRASDLRALVVAVRSDRGNREVKHLQSSRVLIAVHQECVCVRQISCGINHYLRKEGEAWSIKTISNGRKKDKN